VLHSEHAAPVLSQLLWDTSGVVTHGGSPAAHLFESARSLGVPAVTGIDLPRHERLVVAVDGFAGIVATLTVGE
jgi:signal transduction protein with GAF and PtsI domain